MRQQEIQYLEYREYIASQESVNKAMIALLAATRLTANALQTTASSMMPLSVIYPQVEHIERFNLRTDVARDLLLTSDEHLTSAAVTYALATHEEFVQGSIALLGRIGMALRYKGKPLTAKQVRPFDMHEVLFESTGQAPPHAWLQCFALIREMRNCVVHSGKLASPWLEKALRDMSADAVSEWKRLTRRPPQTLIDRGRIVPIPEHVFAAFAITKRLGREINWSFARTISAKDWSSIAVRDYAECVRRKADSDGRETRLRNSSSWRRGLIGYARQYYGSLGLNESDLIAAAQREGLWTLMSTP